MTSFQKEFTLSDFTTLPRKFLKYAKHHELYETFEYPEYERICWRIQKYINVSPSETLENMMLENKKRLYNALSIFDAIKDGDLNQVKKVNNEG